LRSRRPRKASLRSGQEQLVARGVTRECHEAPLHNDVKRLVGGPLGYDEFLDDPLQPFGDP
jgi:hypothetical protein